MNENDPQTPQPELATEIREDKTETPAPAPEKKKRNVLRFIDPNFFDLPKADGEQAALPIPIRVVDADQE
ncbi:MAG: hypothetical protein ACJ790_11665 [Myxococcaceae bacterium]